MYCLFECWEKTYFLFLILNFKLLANLFIKLNVSF